MEFELSKTSSFSFINLKTGEKVLEGELNTSDFTVENKEDPRLYGSIWKPSATLTLSGVEFNTELLNKLLYPDTKTYNLTIKGDNIVSVQARKHNSKRINKKWLKRYGYKNIKVPFIKDIKNCTIDCKDNEFTIEGKV